MVELIVGSRGSGKTKRLIEAVKKSAEETLGNVVCLEKGSNLNADLPAEEIRLIDLEEYCIEGADTYYGFISGILAGNYDITDIYCDATYRIICGENRDSAILENFIKKLEVLSEKHGCKITLTVSTDPSNIPEGIKSLIV